MFDLLDVGGGGFEIAHGRQHIPIKYGEYSLAIANIDYGKLQVFIEEYLATIIEAFAQAKNLSLLNPNSTRYDYKKYINEFSQYGIMPDALSEKTITAIIKEMEKPLFNFLDNGYLNKRQLRIVTLLILSEFDNCIRGDSFNWKDENSYLPAIFAFKELRQHLDSILLRDSDYFSEDLKNALSQKLIFSSIEIDKDGIARTTYCIDDTLSFLLIDLQKYLSGDKTVLRCENPDCRRLYYPRSKNNHYCDLPHKGTNKTCSEIMRNKVKDEFAGLAKLARGKQQKFVSNAKDSNRDKFIINEELLDNLYYEWKDNCNEKMRFFRSINDIDGFKEWIEETRFTVGKLEELGVRIRKPKPKKGRG